MHIKITNQTGAEKTQIYQVKRRLVDVDVSSYFFGQSFPNSTIVYPI